MVDNGYASFNQVRIPRTDLLSRLCEVEKDGSFSIKGDYRLIYQIMLRTRQAVMNTAFLYTAMSCRFAIRYAVCRRQFRTLPGSREERKLLDYQTHMAIIAPVLSYAFVI